MENVVTTMHSVHWRCHQNQSANMRQIVTRSSKHHATAPNSTTLLLRGHPRDDRQHPRHLFDFEMHRFISAPSRPPPAKTSPLTPSIPWRACRLHRLLPTWKSRVSCRFNRGQSMQEKVTIHRHECRSRGCCFQRIMLVGEKFSTGPGSWDQPPLGESTQRILVSPPLLPHSRKIHRQHSTVNDPVHLRLLMSLWCQAKTWVCLRFTNLHCHLQLQGIPRRKRQHPPRNKKCARCQPCHLSICHQVKTPTIPSPLFHPTFPPIFSKDANVQTH
mmetsp:Transcript_30908/g.59005  ORF Transcript_30908/g.59005 Transcript_30908/m.59005 type:complete len:273 (+) Transcript_30908:434-1252(+)